MFERDDMTTLHQASECKATAEEAPDAQQLKAVAFAINNAANCGELSVEFAQVLRPNVKSELEGKGYTTRYVGGAYPDHPVVISWK